MTKSNDAPPPSPHENPLSPADVDAIASGLAPLALPPDRARALRQRIMDTVRAVAAEQNGPPLTRTIRAAEGEWKTIAPRVHVKLLYKDGEARTYLLRIDPGGVVPGHPHDADEECIVLEGEAFCGDFRVAAGDYHLAMRGSVHTGISSPGGALLFLRSTGAPHTSLV